ncbi:MAG: hypothetical protein ABR538_11835 [Candidatus Binatia bacterium]
MRLARFAAALFLAFLVLPADDALALSGAESACRDAVAKSATRYAASASKALVRCHQRRSKGALPLDVDCNNVVQADIRVRLVKERQEARAAVEAACAGSESILGAWLACPSPASDADDGGATMGIDDFGEVADCLLALGDAHAEALAGDAMGAPDERLLDPLRKCQGALGKGSQRLLFATMAERRRCQNRADVEGGDGGYACDDADPRGRIQKAASRMTAKAGATCAFGPDALDDLGACSDQTDTLVECSSESAAAHGAALIHAAYSMTEQVTTTLPPTTSMEPVTTTTLPGTECGDTFPQCDGSCPTGTSCVSSGASCSCVTDGTGPCAPATIYRKILSRYSTDVESVTGLGAGWSGIALDIDVPDGSRDVVDVTCDENCENCAVSLNTDANDGFSNCRCTSDPTVTCDVINGSDPGNCGSLDPTCRCHFSAPLAISSGGNPACVAVRLRDDYQGTMNLRTGEWSDKVRLAAVVYLGLDTARPCPTCEGDPVPNDGVRGGTCNGGLGSGACDAHGVHPTFGATSNDCPPIAAANISGTGLLLDLDLSTSEVSLAATLPCDTPSGALCACRVCTGNSNLSCSSDAQCAAISAGTCTASGGAGVRLNQCDGFLCDADGECTTGPVETYCDGTVYPDGTGFIPCTGDSDCSSSNAGTCTLQQLRRCFPDPIVASGVPDTFRPTSVSAFCIAHTSNPAINIASGLPGPGTLAISVDNDIRCQSDPNLVYEFPSGANCAMATTTTTLLPVPDCEDSDSPVCGGICPLGQVCADNAGVCGCTGVPLPSCNDAAAPLCGGFCVSTDEVCTDMGGTCECALPTLPQCANAAAPLCGGLCPVGEICQSVGDSCECGAPGLPSCGTAISPTCAGLCDVGESCIDQGGTCGCLDLGLPTCAESAAPLCGGTCSLGSLCQDVGGFCQCVSVPIQ